MVCFPYLIFVVLIMNIRKILQRRLYDILSNKCYILLVFMFSSTSFIAVLHFCEVWVNGMWSPSNPNGNINFLDNIGGKSLQSRLCQYFPIDVVYTWVNGSDPVFITQRRLHERRLWKELSKRCPLPDCVPSHLTAFNINLTETHSLMNELNYLSLKPVEVMDEHWTLLRWDSIASAEDHADRSFDLNERFMSPFHVHWTTDENTPHFYQPSNTIAIKGVNKSLSGISKDVLEQYFGNIIDSIWIYPTVIFAELNSPSDVKKLLKGKKWNIVFIKHMMKLNVTRAGWLLKVPSNLHTDDYAPSRYEDKEELRYSLRSLEKYAPWVRKIFIVTNGQLPYWLDMTNPRVQIVTHDSIFTNSSHLPTFSSPAIETHLHRIPGISDKFIYFNDDIFLGEEVLPEDFITSRGGQKVYLSWPVPDCSSVCPWIWVGDGTCDIPCNTSSCAFDGEDCLPHKQHASSHIHINDDYTDYAVDFENKRSKQKLNRSYLVPDDYEEKPFIIKKEMGDEIQNNSYAINNDEELKELLQTLAQNNTVFTSDIVQETFSLLKAIYLNPATDGNLYVEHKGDGKVMKMINKTFVNSILLGLIKENSENAHKTSVTIGRNLLTYKYKDVNKTQEKHEPFVMEPNKHMNPTRIISPLNLSRNQVGVPPIGVAETFYAFQPEISSLQRKLDTFAESLLHVNKLLNKRYGYKARKVPSHMPHLVDKNIIFSLHKIFPNEYNKTSSHYFRHPEDMQFSFGYFYYLMSEEVDVSISEIFDGFDTDDSGSWSDREIRTVLTHIYDLPLQRSSVLNFETSLLYCAKDYRPDDHHTTPPFERYIDSKLPTVTKHLVENCSLVSNLLKRKMGRRKRFLYTLVKPTTRESLVSFHMITSNLTYLLTTLDKIRRKPKKFICLNDNMDATKEQDNQLIRAVLVDFFHSLFPKPSQFELPAEFRNRYLYYQDLLVWQAKSRMLSLIMYPTLTVTILGFFLSFCCFLDSECRKIKRKAKRRLQKLFTS